MAHERYPLMPLDKQRQPFLDKSGRAIVINDKEEETAFYADHPGAVEVPQYVEPMTHEEQVKALNEKIGALTTQVETLTSENTRMREVLQDLGHAPPKP